MRKKTVLGNWKMNGNCADAERWALDAARTAAGAAHVEVGVLPAYVHLDLVRRCTAGALAFGAQDVAVERNGAYTGAVSAEMLSDLGATWVLVGHSERRHVYGDSDEAVARKYARALEAGLHPVLCLGETLAERDAGQTEAVVLRQLNAILELCGAQSLSSAIVAYEPVWAIGTGRTATPAQAQQVHACVRSAIAKHDAMLASLVRILYGGSVKGSNAAQLFSQPDVDGGLIGGASLIPEEFAAICQAADQEG
ncbi:MAG: triose-phosphate isomerase [Lysobacterales bacterium]